MLSFIGISLKKIFFVWGPTAAQFALVSLFWLVVTPSLAATVYRFLIRTDSWTPAFPPDEVSFSSYGLLEKLLRLFFYLSDDAITGISIICVIGVSFLVMVRYHASRCTINFMLTGLPSCRSHLPTS